MTGFAYFMRSHLNTWLNLVALWRLDERTGTLAYDTSRNTNNGALNGTTSVPGKIGYARSFDGLDDLIRVPHHATLDITQAFTLEVYLTSAAGGARSIIAKRDYYHLRQLSVRQPALTVRSGATSYTTTSSQQFPADTWLHFAATWVGPGNPCRLWQDGEELPYAAQPAIPGILDTAIEDFTIGAWRASAPAFYWQGIIDHAAVHSQVLSKAVLKQHAERS